MELFLRNALPCGYIHVINGRIDEETIDSAIKMVSENKEIPVYLQRRLENLFYSALKKCEAVARKNKHSEIYSDDIREYFSPRIHNREIEKRCSAGKFSGKFEPELCKIRKGEVFEFSNSMACVQTGKEYGFYRTDFVKGCLRKGDDVSLHHHFIVEILSGEKIRKYFI